MDMNPAVSCAPKGNDSQDGTVLVTTGTDSSSLPVSGPHSSLLGTTIDTTSDSSSRNGKPLDDTIQETYSPWDMPPIIHPVSSNQDTRGGSGLKGFGNLNSTFPHFRSKPHPTISVPITPTSLSRPSFDMAAPSTPPRGSAYSNPEDSDNAMCTPTFGSSNSNSSRRNSAVSVMALDTPPPLSLMDLESSSSSSSLPGLSFGSGSGHSLINNGPMARSLDSGFIGGYPFPSFGMRHDASSSFSRRSSRANSVSMESRHVRKPSEDTNMSDGGNNSGSERSRRHSPAVVPFERSVRRSALLPKPKGLLKVFSQLEEEVHHNRHEYDHERETTQVRKGAGEEPSVALMETGGAASTRLGTSPLYPSGSIRRQSMSRLNPEQELNDFQRQQEEYDKLYQLQQQHLAQFQHHQQQQHPIQVASPMQESSELDNPSYIAHPAPIATMPSSPLQAQIVTRSKRKSSTCEERFDPYHSSHLKRRAVSPSIGPMVSHRRSPSGSPARHLPGHSRSKIAALPSPSGTGSFFRHGHGPLGGGSTNSALSIHGSSTLESSGTTSHNMNISNRNHDNSNNINREGTSAPSVSSTVNLQHTSRSFSELSLGIPESHAH
ncbi:hypothetical protein BGX27_007135 [Mortierella sp. AM989]|nr:hypothetical protein BGX27_007135 [Mortierella sp. AM989]